MTLADQSDVHLDLRSALYTATSLQTTIRHADAKARIMLGLLGGSVVVVLQQAPTLGRFDSAPLLAATAVAAVVWLAALAAGGWHLLAAVSPRLSPADPPRPASVSSATRHGTWHRPWPVSRWTSIPGYGEPAPPWRSPCSRRQH